MKTEIKINSRLEAINTILKLERLDIKFSEHKTCIVADITPERAWNLSLI